MSDTRTGQERLREVMIRDGRIGRVAIIKFYVADCLGDNPVPT
jgi:hypothetical protein